jgi:hypothetical protein
MKDLLVLLAHLLTTVAKLLGRGGARAVVADNLLMKQQLLVINRSRRRAPNVFALDRIFLGFWSLFLSPRRIQRAALFIRPSTLLRFHEALRRRKYRLFFSSRPKGKPGPKGPSPDLIRAIVEFKRRNPRFGCPRIALVLSKSFGMDIDKDIVRGVLAKHYRPAPSDGGPSWLSFLGHTKDSLWSIDLFRCESILLNTHWAQVSPKSSSYHAQQCAHKGILLCFAGDWENPIEILAHDEFGEAASHVGEGEMAASGDSMAAFGFVFKLVGKDSGQRCGDHAEMQMVGDRMEISGLLVGAPDVLLEFFVAGLEFPACPIPADDLLDGQRQIGAEQGAPLVFAIDPHDPHGTFQGLEHEDLLAGHHLAEFAVELDEIGSSLVFEASRQTIGRALFVTVFLAATAAFFRSCLGRQCAEGDSHAQAREQMEALADGLAHGFEQTIIAEPAIGDDEQIGRAESAGHPAQHLHGLFELGSEGGAAAVDLNLAGLDVLLHVVEQKGHRQTASATLDEL